MGLLLGDLVSLGAFSVKNGLILVSVLKHFGLQNFGEHCLGHGFRGRVPELSLDDHLGDSLSNDTFRILNIWRSQIVLFWTG